MEIFLFGKYYNNWVKILAILSEVQGMHNEHQREISVATVVLDVWNSRNFSSIWWRNF